VPDIIVTGRRISHRFWGFGFDETGGYSIHPQLEPETGSGASWENNLSEIHNAKCATPQDAAKSISNAIIRTADTGSENNWKKFEYGTAIVRDGSRYIAFQHRIQTDWPVELGEHLFAQWGRPKSTQPGWFTAIQIKEITSLIWSSDIQATRI